MYMSILLFVIGYLAVASVQQSTGTNGNELPNGSGPSGDQGFINFSVLVFIYFFI